MAAFYVNGTVNHIPIAIDLTIEEVEIYHKLLTDDKFYIAFIYESASSGRLIIEGDAITRITRFHGLEERVIDDMPDNEIRAPENITNEDLRVIAQNSDSPDEHQNFGLAEHSNCFTNTQQTPDENDGNFLNRPTMTPKDKPNDFGPDEVKFLLHNFGIYMQNMGPRKCFKNKKAIWTELSSDLRMKYDLDKTPEQIQNKYKSIMRASKNVIVHNSKSGAAKMDMPNSEEIELIAKLDDSVQPEVLRSARKSQYLKKSSKNSQNRGSYEDTSTKDTGTDTGNSEHSDTEDVTEIRKAQSEKRKLQSSQQSARKKSNRLYKKRPLSVAEAIIESCRIREIAKDRRHQEKLKAMLKIHGANKYTETEENSTSSATE